MNNKIQELDSKQCQNSVLKLFLCLDSDDLYRISCFSLRFGEGYIDHALHSGIV